MQTSVTQARPPGPDTTPEAPPNATVVVRNLSKWYGDVVAVSDISFHVEPGVTALLGPNGAGKSTTLEMLSGLLAPSQGEIRILGRPARGDVELYRHVGMAPEQEALYPFLTGREFVELNAVLQKMDDPSGAAHQALATVELLDDADRPLRGYSKGMRQRTKIAAALVHDPDVLLMDEPLNGTDPLQRARLIELIQALGRQGKTVIVSSHILYEVERFADRILVINRGKLAAAGNFHAIRDRMDEHARAVRLRASDPRKLAAALVQTPVVLSVRFEPVAGDLPPALVVETADVRAFYRLAPAIAKRQDVHLYEVAALDESLASVFAYVVERG
ncbi:MAG TPA: ABC transporter ATP-binding protein [Thermomicrobiales bacterium]|nr:ABC transporter [Chloroflexota bacterium]HCG30776.1 ABC transporter [Chloroflexota bacterium]HQX63384.1 ABC transporter ATP-binding protein [Thermomicrobiales bacterium]HQZ88887.1 ABC transporter ATP-binding protein [Thermomicrobiales bacterium]HRA32910.1 ABC transporter ATP-binding protein [Thermomicrobiales bacterium]